VQRRVGDIATEPQNAFLAQLGNPCGQAGGIDIGEQQCVSAGMTGTCELPAEAAGGPGDKGHAHQDSPSCGVAADSTVGGRRDQNQARLSPEIRCQQPQKAAISSMPPAWGKKVKMITRPSAEFWIPVSSVTARVSSSLRRTRRALQ